jgi:hypothetical protein
VSNFLSADEVHNESELNHQFRKLSVILFPYDITQTFDGKKVASIPSESFSSAGGLLIDVATPACSGDAKMKQIITAIAALLFH